MRVGVLGSMVWDTIDHPDAPRVERWGGIAYSLAAAAAALPDGWTARPIIKVGDDLADRAHAFLRALPGLELPAGLMRVPEPNNRVHLRYHDPHHRHETLTGGVPTWTWEELAPRLEGLDALFINLISGFELTLDTALRLRSHVQGPLYVDLHSLLLGLGADGARAPRPLENRDEWLAAFDLVQANEQELALVAGDDDPVQVARAAARTTGGAILVTRGPAGATWYAPASGPCPWTAGPGTVRSGDVPVARAWTAGDPTGCGDVWGATCFVALLRGQALPEAMAAANEAAGRNVDHRGADGLYEHLRSQPS